MKDNELTLEDLELLKELINTLDEDKKVFKLSKDIIDINEKRLIKEKNKREGDR